MYRKCSTPRLWKIKTKLIQGFSVHCLNSSKNSWLKDLTFFKVQKKCLPQIIYSWDHEIEARGYII